MSILSPPSFCPKCQKSIKWYHNIPILSYVILRGKCAYCGERISPLYPLVEFIVGVLSLLLYKKFSFSVEYFVYLLFSMGMVVVFFVDLFFYIIPNAVTIGGVALWFLTMMWKPFIPLSDAIYGALLGGGLFGIIYVVYYLLTKKVGIGEGDIKLMAMAGLFVGWKATLAVIFLASLTGAIVGLIYLNLSKKDIKNPIPFGPFLSFWLVVAVLYGKPLLKIFGMQWI